ncbi:MutS-related protein [Luteimicrobium sp. DT211]|uniref:MutS-related protein n=1 Tax=Luteimicrobium sp. DT211 TaxID=3393412 RepID=UPI003CEB2A00
MSSVATRASETFASVLHPGRPEAAVGPPRRASDDTLHDLALDQVSDRLAAATRTVDLAALFASPLDDPDDVRYRQAVFADLRLEPVARAVDGFEDLVRTVLMHETAAAQAHYAQERELWHLHAADAYVQAVTALATTLPAALEEAGATSDALAGLARHVQGHVASPALEQMRDRVARLIGGVADVRVDILVRGAKVTVARYDGETDLEQEVLETFARFRQGATGNHPRPVGTDPGLDHVQAAILGEVARLYPELFDDLAGFAREVPDVVEPVLRRAAGELLFYTTYLDLLRPLEQAGLATCLPEVTTAKTLHVRDTYDLALARVRVSEHKPVVTNDLELADVERILVVSGPNQGGKTTTARIFGQLHHLASLGCPVPGKDAHVFLADQVLTQFEREESLDSLEGRLGTDLARMHRLLDATTVRSVVVLNEVFSSTTLDDARFLTRTVLERLVGLDVLAVCVTFIDDMSRLAPQTVSMVAQVDPDDPTNRTLKVERREADGRAYALALAAKYGLTDEHLRGRLAAQDSTAHETEAES